MKMNMGNLFNSPVDIIKGNPELMKDKQKYERTVKYLEEKYNKARSKLKHKYGDHLSLLNVYDKYIEVSKKDDYNKLNKWAYDHFLKLDPLIKARKHVRKISMGLKRELPLELKPEDLGIEFNEKILKLPPGDRCMVCLLMGYSLNRATKKDKNIYRTKYHKDRIQLDRNSFLNINKTLPTDVIYSELFISMGRSELNIVSKIPTELQKLASY
jgi:hypothetical protein